MRKENDARCFRAPAARSPGPRVTCLLAFLLGFLTIAAAPGLSPAPPLPHSPAASLQYSPWDLVLALAWSPDGKLLAVSAGEWVHLYAARSFDEVGLLETGVWTPALAFSPDGRSLVSGSRDGSIRRWDPASGALQQTFSGHPKGVNGLDFSPDGRLLATSGNDGLVRIWDLTTGAVVARLIGGVYAVPSVAFSRDGGRLATADGRNLRLREVSTQRLALTLRGPESFYSLDFSPNGRLLAAGDCANGIQIWESDSGKLLRTLAGHTGQPARSSGLVWKVAFSPDGARLASAGGDGTLRLWEAATGEALTTLSGHALAVTSAAFSPDGRWLASGSLDATVHIWELKADSAGQ